MFRKVLLLCAFLAPSAATAEWQVGTSRHFVLYSNDTPAHVEAFTSKLERFDKAMRVMRGLPDLPISPSSRVTVYVVDRVSDVQRLAGKHQRNVAGFYEARTQPAAFVPRSSSGGGQYDLSAMEILLHEYTHHFMFSNWSEAAFPMWLSEGFAEFNATVKFGDDGSLSFGAPPMYRVYGIINGSAMPVNRLLDPQLGKLDDDQEQALYGRGWLLTHYLTFEPTRQGELSAYIAAINAGKPVQEAMQALHDVKHLDSALDAYVRRPTLSGRTLKGDGLKIDPVTVRALSPAEAAMMPALIRSKNGVDTTTAPPVADLARKLAAPYPNDPAAQNVLTEAEHDAGNYDAALAAADRALVADPTSIHALLYKGMTLAEMAHKAGKTDQATWGPIRGWYLAANKLDYENPMPLILFYGSFGQAKQQPTKNAEAALLYAYALAPYDESLRVEACYVYLRQGNADGARKALTPVAYSPHAGAARLFYTHILQVLADRGRAAALAELHGTTKNGTAPKNGDSRTARQGA
jgi:tetratricopeptide (TPR) repeat protein